MKKTLLATLILLFCAASLSAATDVTVGKFKYYLRDDSTASVSGRSTSNNSAELVIPSQVVYDGVTYRVTSIGNSAFYKDALVTSVVLPNTIVNIAAKAFCSCGKLTSVYLGDSFNTSLKTIGWEAFYGCPIKDLIVPEGVEIIEADALKGVSNKLVLPLSLKRMECDLSEIKTIVIKNPDVHYNFNFLINEVYFYCKTPPVVTGSLPSKVYVPRGSKELYASMSPFDKAEIIEFGVEQAKLRINQGDYGSVVLDVDKDCQHTIALEQSELWQIQSVMFNGEDVTESVDATGKFMTPAITADENVLSVVYEHTIQGIEDIEADGGVHVSAFDGRITIEGAAAGTAIGLYGIDGRMMRQATASTGSGVDVVEAQPGQVYLLRVGSRTFKLRL